MTRGLLEEGGGDLGVFFGFILRSGCDVGVDMCSNLLHGFLEGYLLLTQVSLSRLEGRDLLDGRGDGSGKISALLRNDRASSTIRDRSGVNNQGLAKREAWKLGILSLLNSAGLCFDLRLDMLGGPLVLAHLGLIRNELTVAFRATRVHNVHAYDGKTQERSGEEKLPRALTAMRAIRKITSP